MKVEQELLLQQQKHKVHTLFEGCLNFEQGGHVGPSLCCRFKLDHMLKDHFSSFIAFFSSEQQ